MRRINFGQKIKILQNEKFAILKFPKPYEILHFQVVDPKSQKTQNCPKTEILEKVKKQSKFQQKSMKIVFF